MKSKPNSVVDSDIITIIEPIVVYRRKKCNWFGKKKVNLVNIL